MKKSKKSMYILTAALLTASLGGVPSALAAEDTSYSANPIVASSATEVPNVKVIQDGDEPNSGIGIFSLILSTTANFPLGQGSLNFDWKAPSSGTEKVRIYIKNNSGKAINYRLVSPTNFTWVDYTIDPGKSATFEHIFSSQSAGQWTMYFDNSDGSAISVEVNVRDGL